MLKVYDLIQELSKCDADDEVVFNANMEILLTTDGDTTVEGTLKGTMEVTDIHTKNGKIEIDLSY